MNQFQSWYSRQPVALRALLTINVVIYVLWQIFLIFRVESVASFVFGHLALHPQIPNILFEPWQLVTYNFLHLGTGFGGFLHILFNMLWLVWIGREYEEMHGSHKLMAVYLLAGIGGGLLTVLLHLVFPSFGPFGGIVYGASASVLGVLMAVATLYPYKSVAMLFIGTIRLIHLVIAFLVLDLLLSAGSDTSVSAHLGGALFGFLYAKAERSGIDLASWARVFFPERKRGRRAYSKRQQKETVLNRMEAWLGSKNREKETSPQKSVSSPLRRYEASVEVESTSLQSEVDRILDKISEKGYEALTEEEKRTLYEASRR